MRRDQGWLGQSWPDSIGQCHDASAASDAPVTGFPGHRRGTALWPNASVRAALPQPPVRLPAAARLAAWLIFNVALTCSSLSAENDLGVTVTEKGEVLARPDCLEIDLRAAGGAELSSDAIVKYHDRLRRVTDAFKKLDVKRLRLEQRELSIGNAVDEQHPRPHVTIARALRIVVTDIHELAEDELLTLVGKVIDTAKDTGAGGEETETEILTVRFAVREPKPLREEACRKAFDDARDEATRFARLAGGRLGRVLSVQDLSPATTHAVIAETMVSQTLFAIYGREAEPGEPSRTISDSLKEIPVRVSLRVRFELLDSPEETAETVAEQ